MEDGGRGRRPVWLDCDPGHDDAMAIILAAHSDLIDLLGISTVAGNQEVAKVTKNALKVLHLCGRGDVGVVMGQARPLLRPPRACPEIHGDTGLDGPALPVPAVQPLEGKAVNVMFQKIASSYATLDKKVVALVCTAALTNVALLLSIYPEVIPMIEMLVKIVLMGGCLGLGNTGPVMEFNIQCDPEAAKIVFESLVPTTMIPLEVTHTALVTPDVLSRIRTEKPSPFRNLVAELLLFFAETYRSVFFFEHPPLHDPCAVAYVIAPEIFQVENLRVDVEVNSQLSAGQTVCDIWRQSGQEPNVTVARGMDVHRFWELLYAAFDKADKEASTIDSHETLKPSSGSI